MLRTMSVVDVRRLAAVDMTGSILLPAHDPALVVDHERAATGRVDRRHVVRSREEPVDLDPLLGGIVAVRPVYLPPGACRTTPVSGAPLENRIVCRSHLAEGSTVHGHRGDTSGERRGD